MGLAVGTQSSRQASWPSVRWASARTARVEAVDAWEMKAGTGKGSGGSGVVGVRFQREVGDVGEVGEVGEGRGFGLGDLGDLGDLCTEANKPGGLPRTIG